MVQQRTDAPVSITRVIAAVKGQHVQPLSLSLSPPPPTQAVLAPLVLDASDASLCGSDNVLPLLWELGLRLHPGKQRVAWAAAGCDPGACHA